MTSAVYVNGRFLSQPFSGVQRFSAEITAAIDRLAVSGAWPETAVLVPRLSGSCSSQSRLGTFQRLTLKDVGHTRGHIWEQMELPAAARDGVLINLGNTAPVLTRERQVVVIHDTGVFDMPESYSFRFRTWYKALQRSLVRLGAHVVTVSNFSRDRIVACLGLDPARISVMYEGADHIRRVASDRRILERHDLRPKRFAVVVGNRAVHKNLAALHEAANLLTRRGFAIAVAGGSNREIFRETAAAGQSERLLGRVTDGELRALYENAACLLFPSRYEGFGLPAVEALACGCPVVASGGGAVEEICGDSALYFDSLDKHTITTAIRRLLDDARLADELRRRGHRRAAALSWEASARALGSFIDRMEQ